MSDCYLMPNEQYSSYTMARKKCISMRLRCLLCTRQTHLPVVGFLLC